MSIWSDWLDKRHATRAARTASRWVVIDTETSGLDTQRDHLIAAAAVAVHLRDGRPQLCVADSFDVVLQCPPGVKLDEVARRNILLHGVGRGEQRAGLTPPIGLQSLLDFADGAPCLAFHAAFDAHMLNRACQQHLRSNWSLPWLDLAVLARTLMPDLPHRHLDDWVQHFGLQVGQRHRAISDAWVAAELLLRLWPAWQHMAGLASPWVAAQELLHERRYLGQTATTNTG
jgi:DNA polymerase-3 subunit epsilon